MNTSRLPAELLSNYAFYAQHFMNTRLWEPLVRQVCSLHGFACQVVTPGIAGTFPTFIASPAPRGSGLAHPSVVIKFFGRLYDGVAAFEIEITMGRFCSTATLPIPSPAILASGRVDEDWQYLVFERIQGIRIGDARAHLCRDAWTRVSTQVGRFLNSLHTKTAHELPSLTEARHATGWQPFLDFLSGQIDGCKARHLTWRDLPHDLAYQIPEYLLPLDQLIDLSAPAHLIHADLTADHLLGNMIPSPLRKRTMQESSAEEMDWESLAVIDWGDARSGNILYELVAPHVDLFHADRALLKTCLDAYGLPEFYRSDFTRKLMCMLLLHQFPMPGWLYAPHQDARTLDELSERLFAE